MKLDPTRLNQLAGIVSDHAVVLGRTEMATGALLAEAAVALSAVASLVAEVRAAADRAAGHSPSIALELRTAVEKFEGTEVRT